MSNSPGPNNRLHGSVLQLAASNAVPSDNGKTWDDPTWAYNGEGISASNWNKSYPYQLMLLKAQRDPATGHMTYDYKYVKNGIFTLPIPPTDMTIGMPMAISTQPTLHGIVEEHNGAPLRPLAFNGTFGVMPGRTTSAVEGIGPGLIPSPNIIPLPSGTIQAVVATVQQAAAFTANLINAPRSFNLIAESKFTDDSDTGKLTGYAQFRLLQKFLEAYITAKKGEGGKDLRLAVATWKDDAVYLVTPKSFDVRRSASSPLEYMYSMQFMAWGRVKLWRNQPANDRITPLRRNPQVISQVLNTLLEVRETLQSAAQILDIAARETVLAPIQAVIFGLKVITNAPLTLLDVGVGISAEVTAALLEAKAENRRLQGLSEDYSRAAAKASLDITGQWRTVFSAETNDLIVESAGDAAGALSVQEQSTTKVSSLKLQPSTKDKLNKEIKKAKNLKRSDYQAYRDTFYGGMLDLTDRLGAGSPELNDMLGRPQIVSSKVTTTQDYDLLYTLNEAALALDSLVVATVDESAGLASLDFIANAARGSGIAFTSPISKFLVPFPYGTTLEQLALQYLGDANRWIEIAALNGLRSPYIDEVGFDIPLLTNGVGNSVVLATGIDLFVGQTVLIASKGVRKLKTKITKMVTNAPGVVTVSLDAQDLSMYTTVDGAFIHAWLPDTVNSNQHIYIPSAVALPDSDLFSGVEVPGATGFEQLITVGGADFLLSNKGDLTLSPEGDIRYAVGLTNLGQKARIAFATPRGSLVQHPGFGLALEPGVSHSDLDAKSILKAAEDLFADDPSFTAVRGARVVKKGPVSQVTMSLEVAGSSVLLPLSFDVVG